MPATAATELAAHHLHNCVPLLTGHEVENALFEMAPPRRLHPAARTAVRERLPHLQDAHREAGLTFTDNPVLDVTRLHIGPAGPNGIRPVVIGINTNHGYFTWRCTSGNLREPLNDGTSLIDLPDTTLSADTISGLPFPATLACNALLTTRDGHTVVSTRQPFNTTTQVRAYILGEGPDVSDIRDGRYDPAANVLRGLAEEFQLRPETHSFRISTQGALFDPERWQVSLSHIVTTRLTVNELAELAASAEDAWENPYLHALDTHELGQLVDGTHPHMVPANNQMQTALKMRYQSLTATD